MYRDANRKSSATVKEPLPRGRSVVVVIGINVYKEWSRLGNAVPDARGIQGLFADTLGFEAPFEPMLDETATKGAIIDLVDDRLRKYLQEDDSLLLFFAGHGHTRVDRVGNTTVETGYIVPVEARWTEDVYYGDLIELDSFLDTVSKLPARHILVILDSCHSGLALTPDTDRSMEEYRQVLESRLSRKVITSARGDEKAQDGGPVPGHSLFTGTLIDGLRTHKADRRNKDFVTSSELGLYVQQQVAEEAKKKGKQTPDFGSFHLDNRGEMVIAFRLEDAKNRCELGYHLYELGWMLDDEGRFRSAERNFDTAIRLSPQALPHAHLGRGQARLALGRYREAIEDLRRAVAGESASLDAWLYLGIAQAKWGKTAEAIQSLGTFAERQPDDDRTRWAQELVRRLQSQPSGKKHALLIGIGEYIAHPQLYNLRGPANDVQILYDALVDRYEFPTERITTLRDDEATREGILDALDALHQKAGPGDTVLIYYSGHAASGDHPTYITPHDTVIEPSGLRNTIKAEELDQIVRQIPAASKTLVLDTHATYKFVELARNQADYTLFLATSPDREAYEHRIPGEGGTKYVGLFTYAFVHQLEQSDPETMQGKIWDGVVAGVQSINEQQTPFFVGDRNQHLFGRRRHEAYLTFFDLSQRQNYAALSVDEIRRQYAGVQEGLTVPLPWLHFRVGRALLDKGAYAQALEALETAVEQAGERYPEAVLALGIAQLRLQCYKEALEAFRRFLKIVPEHKEPLKEPLALLGRIGQGRRHALLVGVNEYAGMATVHGAINDVRELERILVGSYGFQEADITVLCNEEATQQAIRDAFEDLVARAREEPALFYFAGAGTLSTDGTPAIVCCAEEDAHFFVRANEIKLRDLAASVGGEQTNLVAIVDAGWRSVVLPWGALLSGGRFVPSLAVARDVLYPDGPKPGPWSSWKPEPEAARERERVTEALHPIRIGRLSIYQVSIRSAFEPARQLDGEAVVEAEFKSIDGEGRTIHGVLTRALLLMLEGHGEWKATLEQRAHPDKQTYAQLAQGFADRLKWLQPFVLADNLDEVIFGNPVVEEALHDTIGKRFFQEPIRQAISLLQNLVERERVDPQDYLDLGVAYAALGDYDTSIATLEKAVDQMGEPCPEAHYHLGRALFERGDDLDRAASELKAVVEQTPDNARAHYYRGETRRLQAERDLLVEAVEAYQAYLSQGAPLGRADEIRQFLESRPGGMMTR